PRRLGRLDVVAGAPGSADRGCDHPRRPGLGLARASLGRRLRGQLPRGVALAAVPRPPRGAGRTGRRPRPDRRGAGGRPAPAAPAAPPGPRRPPRPRPRAAAGAAAPPEPRPDLHAMLI